jgi:cytochrome oxidase Cu insertion factor (SCO1/SenC/PrrC family)
MKLRHLLLLVVSFTLLPACQVAGASQPRTDQQAIDSPMLPDLGPAPELKNDVWLNSGTPLRLADLRGQVVLLDMWTYG